ncbi:PQQ-binding-like beta-propeller repeat protein [Kitasatospora sp. NPDC006697]|uniref:outer membrane protein assembly factor BamB family protein n=1 Tax=Kitasatospora sp. NPDC006697 TaxID=3364020 RepID=UPI00369BE363
MDGLGPGQRLDGRYLLLAELGADRWRCRDERVGREVAVAVYPVADEAQLGRCEAGLRAAAGLVGPTLVQVHDVGRAVVGGRALPYLVTELPAGLLSQSLPAPAGRAVVWAEQLGRALADAHAQGVPHGLLSPELVLIGADGSVRLSGFELAALQDPPLERAEAAARDPHGLGLLLGLLAPGAPDGVRALALALTTPGALPITVAAAHQELARLRQAAEPAPPRRAGAGRSRRSVLLGAAAGVAALAGGAAVFAAVRGGGGGDGSGASLGAQPVWTRPRPAGVSVTRMQVFGSTVVWHGDSRAEAYRLDDGTPLWNLRSTGLDGQSKLPPDSNALMGVYGVFDGSCYSWVLSHGGPDVLFGVDEHGATTVNCPIPPDAGLDSQTLMWDVGGGIALFPASPPGSSRPQLTALDVSSGRLLWRRPINTPDRLYALSVQTDGKLVHVLDGGTGYAVDARTGADAWQAPNSLDPARVARSVLTARVWAVLDGTRLLGLDPATGRQLWSNKDVRSDGYLTSCAVGDRLYFGCGPDAWYVDAATGHTGWHWTADSGAAPDRDAGGDASSTHPAFAGPGFAAFAAAHGTALTVLDSASGRRAAVCRLPGSGADGHRMAAVAGRTVLALDGNTLNAYR